MNFFRLDDFDTSDRGVSLGPWLTPVLFDLASEMGVMLPKDLEAELVLDLEGTERRLGGLEDFSLPEMSRALTLLATLEASLPLTNWQTQHIKHAAITRDFWIANNYLCIIQI